MKYFAVSLILAALSSASQSPLFVSDNGELIPNEYIVQLREPNTLANDNGATAAALLEQHLQTVFPDAGLTSPLLQKYENGYAAIMDSETLNRVRDMPDVEFVEQNQVVHASEVQNNPKNWGLDRASHKKLPLKREYLYSETAGEGVDVYIVDTGVNIEHDDFEGRATWGKTMPTGDTDTDGNGHGTHVASTVAGKNYGVAKKANIIAVKVLRSSGSGTIADVLGGINFVGTEHARKTAEGKKVVKSVANMSLGGGRSRALDSAVEKVIAKGVLFVVAAGNDNRDACNYSPAAAKTALTVGASTKTDGRSYFSNYGKCVDIFAPGSDITAAWIGSKTAVKTISGTSMASPMTCGVAALVLAQNDFTPEELKQKVLAMATKGVVKNAGTRSPNLLIYNGGEDMNETATLAEERPITFEVVFEDGVNVESVGIVSRLLSALGLW